MLGKCKYKIGGIFMKTQEIITLNNGVEMPTLGLGVFRVEDYKELVEAIKTAIVVGYRSIDTASIYGNEEAVGEGIRQGIAAAGISREDLFITSKIWNEDMRSEKVIEAYQTSLDKIGVDYLDLYLIHWPVAEHYVAAWQEMEKLYAAKKVRSIGVSNFQVHHLEELTKHSTVTPVINQVEYHPLLTQGELKDYLTKKNIQMEAWSPLMNGEILQNDLILALSQKYGKSAAQIILRWDLQNGVITIPKSTNADRLLENRAVFDFALTEEEVASITALNQNRRIGPDPDNFEF